MAAHTRVYDPYIYADGKSAARVVSRFRCRECDCVWPCQAVEHGEEEAS